MGLQVVDNFLSEYYLKSIQTVMMGDNFPWFYNNRTLPTFHSHYNPKIFQFTQVFFNALSGQKSPVYGDLMDPITSKLNVRRLTRIKANLTPRTFFHQRSGLHVDLDPNNPYQHITTSIFYLNTNNGWTHFKGGGKVKSVANRIVIFNSNLKHQAVTCTDEKRRVVINFNYE